MAKVLWGFAAEIPKAPQVLELYVYSTELTAKVATGVDYRGKSSANVHVAGGQAARIGTPVDEC